MASIEIINKIFRDLKIKAKAINARSNDNYQFFDIVLIENGNINTIKRMINEISLGLKMPMGTVRVVHEQGVIRLEFKKHERKFINLLDYFTNLRVPGELPILLGQDINGDRVWVDLATLPHLLVAGQTGSGKSIIMHNLILNLLNYSNPQLFLFDPKSIEFGKYQKHFSNISVSYSYDESVEMLDNLIEIMEHRYIAIKHDLPLTDVPYIVVIIDEFGDLIMQDTNKEFYNKLLKLSQKCRAAKMHLIISTQRPSVNVINGAIKANFGNRLSCKVASGADSRVVLDYMGAETLLGKGDAILKTNDKQYTRFQAAYTTPDDVCKYFGNKEQK